MRVSHPNLLIALLTHELRVVVFFSLMQSLALFLGNKLQSAKKRKDHCELASDCSFAKMRSFFCVCQTIDFLELPATPIIDVIIISRLV